MATTTTTPFDLDQLDDGGFLESLANCLVRLCSDQFVSGSVAVRKEKWGRGEEEIEEEEDQEVLEELLRLSQPGSLTSEASKENTTHKVKRNQHRRSNRDGATTGGQRPRGKRSNQQRSKQDQKEEEEDLVRALVKGFEIDKLLSLFYFIYRKTFSQDLEPSSWDRISASRALLRLLPILLSSSEQQICSSPGRSSIVSTFVTEKLLSWFIASPSFKTGALTSFSHLVCSSMESIIVLPFNEENETKESYIALLSKTAREARKGLQTAFSSLEKYSESTGGVIALCQIAFNPKFHLSIRSQPNVELKEFYDWVYLTLLRALETDNWLVRMKALNSIQSFLESSLETPTELSSRLEQLWKCIGTRELQGETRRIALITTVRSMEANLRLASLPDPSFDVFSEESFWRMIRNGLIEDDAECRKYSIALLKQTVANSNVKSIKNELKWTVKQWETFFLLYDTMDEFKIHLLKPQWPQIRTLFEDSDSSSSTLSWVSSEWLSVLYRRGLYHRNRSIRRMVMISFLLEFQREGSTLQLIRDAEFVLRFVVKALNQTGLHPPFLLMLLEFDRGLSIKPEELVREKTTSSEDVFQSAFADEDEGDESEEGRKEETTEEEALTPKPTSSLQTKFFVELRRALVYCFSSLSSTNPAFFDEVLQLLKSSVESPSAVLYILTAIQLASSTASSVPRTFSPLTFETICDLISSDRARSSVLNKPLQTSVLSFVLTSMVAFRTNINFVSRFLSNLDFSFLITSHQYERLVEWLYKDSPEWYYKGVETSLEALFSERGISKDEMTTSSATSRLGRMCVFLKEQHLSKVVSLLDTKLSTTETEDFSNFCKVILILRRLLSDFNKDQRRSLKDANSLLVALLSITTTLVARIELQTDEVTSMVPSLFFVKLLDLIEVLFSASRQLKSTEAAQKLASFASSSTLKFLEDDTNQRASFADEEKAIRPLVFFGLWYATRDCTKTQDHASLETTLLRLCRCQLRNLPSSLAEATNMAKWSCIRWLLIEGLTSSEQLSASTLQVVFEHCLSGLEHSTASFVSSVMECLRHLLFGAQPSETLTKVQEDEGRFSLGGKLNITSENLEDMLSSSWRSFSDCKVKSVSIINNFLSLSFHPSLLKAFSREEVAFSNKTGASKIVKEKFHLVAELAQRSLRIAVCLLTHFCEIWERDLQIAEWMLDELVEVCIHTSGSFDSEAIVAEQENIAMMAEGYTHLDARVILLQFFEKLPSSSSSSSSSLISRLLLSLLEVPLHADFIQREYSTLTRTNKAKVNLWQTLCLLSHKHITSDMAPKVNQLIWEIVSLRNFGNVRYYIQLFLISFLTKFPSFIEKDLLQKLKEVNLDYQVATSLVIVASYLILSLQKSTQEDQRRLATVVFTAVLPWMNHYHHAVRVASQILVHKVLTQTSQSPTSMDDTTQGLFHFLENNKDLRRLRERQQYIVDDFNISETLSISNLCDSGRALFLLDEVKKAIKEFQLELSSSSSQAISSAELSSSSSSSSSPVDVQRRIQAWELIALQNTEAMDRMNNLRTRERQTVTVVATLVDNIPNLAGLVRTCEIFRASELIVANKQVLKDPHFQRISVTAEKWLPVQEVKEKDLAKFLAEKKKQGHVLVGVEQTANSVSLVDYQFPRKVVLVLGSEQEGIPGNVLQLLDQCVEIPQLGVIRSLNVHVSASIIVWEYTRQALAQQSQ